MRVCVIVNPQAGGEADDGLIDAVSSVWPEAVIHRTSAAGDASRWAKEAADAGFELVVAAGGDGTIHEVVNGLAGDLRRVRVGVVPRGTGNDFARSADIPDDADAALAALVDGAERRIDLVAVDLNGERRLSVNACTGGFSGAVSERASAAKGNWGPLSYLKSALDAAGEASSHRVEISADDAEPIELDVLNVAVANGSYAANGIPIAPLAELDDGLLDLVVIREAPLSRLSLLAPAFLAGEEPDSGLVVMSRARRVRVESDPPMPFSIDGEATEAASVEFEVLAGALRLAG